MALHFAAYSAIFPLIIEGRGRKRRILLHKRKNTGYQDGMWDIAASGHVDEDETAQMALIRECREELGIEVKLEHIKFAHLSHRLSADRTYYDIYFTVARYSGTPIIMEQEKCEDLQWFDLSNLPPDTIECRRRAIENYLSKTSYSEIIEKEL